MIKQYDSNFLCELYFSASEINNKNSFALKRDEYYLTENI